MTTYETVIVLHPDLGDAGFKEWVAKARTILETGGAEITNVDEWGVRDLAYRIAKQKKAFYGVFEYRAEPPAVAELERQMKLSDRVLRFLTVREPSKLPPTARGAKPQAAA